MGKVTLDNVWKRFGKIEALKGISFECRDGEFFCLLGPSGAGKTTTVRVIAGLELPNEGEIHIDEVPMKGVQPKDRDIAVVFESYALYSHLTVYENLAFPLRAPIRSKDYTKEEIDREVKRVAGLLGIEELLRRLPQELSGGQRQRVALGRALIRKPKVYLMDEPIAHLDAKLRHSMRSELKHIQRSTGITVIYTTPDYLEALSIGDTIAVLNEGKVEQIGTPEEIFEKPANTFVARFIGDPPMNVFDCELSEKGGELTAISDGFKVLIPSEAKNKVLKKLTDSTVKIGIRAADFKIIKDNMEKANAAGEVFNIQVVGQTAVTTVIVGKNELKIKVPVLSKPRAKEKVGLVVDTPYMHYFDTVTGNRLL